MFVLQRRTAERARLKLLRVSAYFESPDDVADVPSAESPSTNLPRSSSTAMAKLIQTVVRTDFNITPVNNAYVMPNSKKLTTNMNGPNFCR